MEAVEKGLRKIGQTATAAADGAQGAKDALAAIGLSSNQLKGLSPENQLMIVVKLLRKLAKKRTHVCWHHHLRTNY
jgi:hypothetical protein